MNYSKLVLFNNCNNGDLHFNKEFIRQFRDELSIPVKLVHNNPEEILKDLGIEKLPLNLWPIHTKPYHIENGTLFLNMWIAQGDGRWHRDHGCTLSSNYKMISSLVEELQLPIKMREEKEYIPVIDYSCFKVNHIKLARNKNVLICNGGLRSGQGRNFDFTPIIEKLSKSFESVNFFVTSPCGKTLRNVVDANNLFPSQCNLNEISYLSTFCDIIVGRASGPSCFSTTKQNLYDTSKTFIAFSNSEREGHHIIMDDYSLDGHAKQIWNEQHVHSKTTEEESSDTVYRVIADEISLKYGN